MIKYFVIIISLVLIYFILKACICSKNRNVHIVYSEDKKIIGIKTNEELIHLDEFYLEYVDYNLYKFKGHLSEEEKLEIISDINNYLDI